MDPETTGMLTIMCNHTFHMQCLAECKEPGCPVCRFSQQPLGMDCKCSRCECALASELWMCLVCGAIGCGRDTKSHALAHFTETQHTYSMNLETKRVWDYISDNYVHRIIQDGTGKLVAVESSKDSKITAIEIRYSQIAQDQLLAFEREKAKTKFQHEKEMRELAAANKTLIQERNAALKSVADAQKASASKADKIVQLEKKLEEFKNVTKQLEQTRAELEEANSLNKSLCENQKELKARIADLESQLHDLMTHLDFADKIEQEPELQGGDLGTVISHPPRGKGSKRGKRKGKK